MVGMLMFDVGATKPVTKPATSPATRVRGSRSADVAATNAVRAAVIALANELAANQRNPSKDGLRTASNYFKDHPSSEITPAAIVAALQSQVGEPRAAAYVRWQLLSGLPDSIDEATAKGLLNAYRVSPGPSMRPGCSAADQQQLDRMVQGKKEEEAAEIVAQLEQAVSRSRLENAQIIAYRDELYRRLPKNAEAFAAAMEDLKQRVTVAAEGKELVKAFTKDMRDWSLTANLSPQQLGQVAMAVRKLADTKGPQYYTSATWRASSNVLSWNKSRAGIDDSGDLKDLAVYLEELATQPALNLESKDKK